MADFAGVKAKVAVNYPFGGHPGACVFTITLSATTYVNGNLNLSGIKLPNVIRPTEFRAILFSIEGSTAAYMPIYTPNTTPTLANLGTLKLFTATGAEASGSLTLVVRGVGILMRAIDAQ